MTDPTKDIQLAVLEDLLAAPADPRRIARKQRISLEELVRILSAPGTIAALRIFAEMNDASATIALGRARINAIIALKTLACDKQNPESSRKACVDLIKCAPAKLAPSPNVEAGDGSLQPIDDATRTMLRQALDAIARQLPDDDA